MIIVSIVSQHAEEAGFLGLQRVAAFRGPHYVLRQLGKLDDRITAHLDGLLIAGEFGWKLCQEALANPGVGEIFAATVRAIEDRNSARLDKLLALAETTSELQPGLMSAFGWASARFMQGTIKNLLASNNAFYRQVGIAACGMHRVDPGVALDAAVADPDVLLRARGLRVVGECGRRDLLTMCLKALSDEDAACRFWAARSAVLLGERDKSIEALKDVVFQAGPHQFLALRLVLKLTTLPQANELLKVLARDPSNLRLLIHGAGIAGDPYYVPWLVKQMEDLKLARLAGESFSFITGLDLADLDLERKPPEGLEFGPNDNPEDDNVAMDEDDNLPWPHPVKIQAWWEANKSRFKNGERYFMGAPVTREHCIHVLKEGYQRQRIAAALYLCLLQPGTQLFPTSAPAWRQKRRLEKMA